MNNTHIATFTKDYDSGLGKYRKGDKIGVRIAPDGGAYIIAGHGLDIGFPADAIKVRKSPERKPKRKNEMKTTTTIKRVWAAFGTHDEYGRYDEVDDLLGVYESEKSAKKAADGQGWWGGEGAIEKRIAIPCGNKWYLTQNPFPVKLNAKHLDPRKVLRKKALGKLTREERAALELEGEE